MLIRQSDWRIKDCNPMGVSSYQLEEVMERTVSELELKKEKPRKQDVSIQHKVLTNKHKKPFRTHGTASL